MRSHHAYTVIDNGALSQIGKWSYVMGFIPGARVRLQDPLPDVSVLMEDA